MLKRLALLALLVLAACAQATPAPSIIDSPREVPTQPAPAWVEPAGVIGLDNVPRVRLLGRLESTDAPSTIFNNALSPDGTLLAGLDNERLIVWDFLNGETVFDIGRRPDAVRVFFSADKAEVYTVESDALVAVHDALTGREQNTFRGIDQYDGALTYQPDSGWLAFANRRGEVRVWDPLERQALVTIQAFERPAIRLAFSSGGDLLAAADSFGAVTIWDWRSRQAVAVIEDDLPALQLQFSPDDSLLAVSTRQDIRLWSLADGSLQRRLKTGPGVAELLAFSPTGSQLISGGEADDMQVWDPHTGSLIARLPGVGGDRISAVFSPDGALLLTADLGGSVTLWNMTTITENTVNRADLDTQGVRIYSVNWTSDGLLMTLFGAAGSVYVWGIPPAD